MGCGPSKSTGAAVAKPSAPSTCHLVDGKAYGAGQTSTSTAASTAPSTTASTTNAAGNRPGEEAAGRQQQQQRKQQPAGEFLGFFLLHDQSNYAPVESISRRFYFVCLRIHWWPILYVLRGGSWCVGWGKETGELCNNVISSIACVVSPYHPAVRKNRSIDGPSNLLFNLRSLLSHFLAVSLGATN